jgi:hypothetical protein
MLANRTIKCPIMCAIHTVEYSYHACNSHYQIFLPCLQSTLSDDSIHTTEFSIMLAIYINNYSTILTMHIMKQS